ncbi:hypothetical protein N9W41_01260 [bacterium]|nr:hypothetical protein [bacterium]
MMNTKNISMIASLLLCLNITSANAGDLRFGGFSEITYKATDSASSNENTFSQGGIDLYMTKSLDAKTNILAEVVFEISGENEAILDPERIWIQHEINNWFKVKAGRVHTALGYWNETFHHGSWLQTSASRPNLLSFEDDGGLLPVHSIGLEFRGSGAMGSNELGYVVDFGNGRGDNPDPPQTGQDTDRSKALSALVYYDMKNIGLRVGAVFHSDNVELASDFNHDGDEATAGVARAGFVETIAGAHMVWTGGNTELLIEGFSVKHDYDEAEAIVTAQGETDNTITAYYAQLSHKMGKWTPYVRMDSISSDENGDIYLGYTADTDKTVNILGARYDLTYTSAVKFEYANEKEVSGGTTNSDDKSFAVNWSYAW